MTQYFAFCVLVSTDHWFQDPVLMQAQSPHVWDTLGVFQLPRDTVYGIALTLTLRPEITVHYIALGNKLSRIPAWQTTISGNLPSLLSHLPQLLEIQEPKKTTEEFCAVLHRIWGANVADDEHMEGEKPLAMAFSALGKVWDEFNSQHTGLFRLIRCTIATAFCARIYHVPLPESWSTEQWHMKNPSQKFNDIVLVRLADSLARAAEQANASEAPDAAAILSRVAPIVNGELRNRPSAGDREAEKSSEINYWHELRQGLYDLTDEHLGRQ
ncbi:hypothetical protein C8R44DRAFT_759854 [Mycena epipterygia]|nr:hypothetical protein C8R44DRAFT_759854 [Mycena epipterygia]